MKEVIETTVRNPLRLQLAMSLSTATASERSCRTCSCSGCAAAARMARPEVLVLAASVQSDEAVSVQIVGTLSANLGSPPALGNALGEEEAGVGPPARAALRTSGGETDEVDPDP